MAFDKLKEIPPDAILGLMTAYQADHSPDKIDLTVGVYKDNQGNTPVMRAVAESERRLIETQASKAYLPPLGVAGFREGIRRMVLGPVDGTVESRTAVIQTPGGCGALRVAADMYRRTGSGDTVYLSNPTWGNHRGLMTAAGLALEEYPYYSPSTHQLEVDQMLDSLSRIPPQSLIVLQASSHNPTGEDPDAATWEQVLDIIEERDILPLFDLAYQGLGDGLDQDAAVIRAAAERLPEMFVAVSCSKNFGLYRERTGALLIMGKDPSHRKVLETQAANVARGSYSMSPAHGPLIVAGIFEDPKLHQLWLDEVNEMRGRIQGLRNKFAQALANERSDLDFSWISHQRGMFSLLGLTQNEVDTLREDQHLYMVRDSRINIAGLQGATIEPIAKAVAPLMS
ncbi:aspartate/tyrosine/aromatic aminotransferase [Marinihelvus fidelis]|uniref:Aspartate/tyrosine/aromatic aminotransferase n=1 Tax=Marinihelvus fidelis TaxID=2613842 RepID=A0A5N0TB82_9GAMM|nr:amino acid aminotransferase [Marinihelvus fidelis]KAA9132001.1 aspartate/tyrosine/aromatic aminotransferase [Marinihelvus fidelis]